MPELMGLLKDENATVRSYGARELARLADKRSADALAEALTDTRGDVQRCAAEGLAKVGDERHVPALVTFVMAHWPEPYTDGSSAYYLLPAIETIGKLSSKAPPELIRLIEQIPDSENPRVRNWWLLQESTARCLGRIGDKGALEPLRRALAVLEKRCQDYRTWYAVRVALGAIDPQNMAFDRPAAKILSEVSWGKGGTYGEGPLTELGSQATEDLAWALRFESVQDHERVVDALKALGNIGGDTAAKILRSFIDAHSVRPETTGSPRQDCLITALAALLKAVPSEETAKEVFVASHDLDDSQQRLLVGMILYPSPHKIPPEIEITFLQWVMLGSEQAGPLEGLGAADAAFHVGGIGGKRTGEILSKALLKSSDIDTAIAIAEALGAIRDYDAVPTLIEASKLTNVPKDAVAYALGGIRDERAVPALRDLMRSDNLTKDERLWVAAALARMGADYGDNARLIREALPESLDQAKWLQDKETVTAIATFVKAGESPARPRRHEPYMRQGRFSHVPGPFSLSEYAIYILTSVGTHDALEALTSRVDIEKIDDLDHVFRVSTAAAHMAERLGDSSKERWATVAALAQVVRASVTFTVAFTQAQGPVVRPDEIDQKHVKIVENDPALARRMWLAGVNRRLSHADGPPADRPDVPGRAVRLAELIFSPELIPALERLAKESKTTEEIHAKRSIVEYYNVRSLAAKVLAEKTGQAYTFVDVDGRTHPGGWNPSLEE